MNLSKSLIAMNKHKMEMYTTRAHINHNTSAMYGMLYKHARAKARGYLIAARHLWHHAANKL